MSGKFERKKAKRRGRGGKIALIVFAVIAVILIAVIAAGVIYYNSLLNKINHVEVPKIVYTEATAEPVEAATETVTAETETVETTEAPTQPHVASRDDYINVLVVGQAAREGEEERFADTMMLFTINTYEKSVTMTSFLRDTLVQQSVEWNGHHFGGNKLTAIYHLGSFYGDGPAGSMELMNLTLYKNFGVEVDHNFEIDFDAFVHIIDELGGVDIELSQSEADYLNDDDFWVYEDVEPGMNTLNGMTALSFARMRKDSEANDSDIVRTGRQRRLVESILAKLETKSPGFIQHVANEVFPMITTSMSNSEITNLMMTLLPMLPDLTIGEGGTCPAESWGDMVDIYGDGMQHSILRFDEAATKKYMRERTLGEVAE